MRLAPRPSRCRPGAEAVRALDLRVHALADARLGVSPAAAAAAPPAAGSAGGSNWSMCVSAAKRRGPSRSRAGSRGGSTRVRVVVGRLAAREAVRRSVTSKASTTTCGASATPVPQPEKKPIEPSVNQWEVLLVGVRALAQLAGGSSSAWRRSRSSKALALESCTPIPADVRRGPAPAPAPGWRRRRRRPPRAPPRSARPVAQLVRRCRACRAARSCAARPRPPPRPPPRRRRRLARAAGARPRARPSRPRAA